MVKNSPQSSTVRKVIYRSTKLKYNAFPYTFILLVTKHMSYRFDLLKFKDAKGLKVEKMNEKREKGVRSHLY